MWLLNHNHRYLHSLRWKKLMLSDGVLMFNVQEALAADAPANTKPMFWKLAAPRIEVICGCDPPLVWGTFATGAAVLVQFCQVSMVQQYGKLGLHQEFAAGKSEPQVQFSYQSMKNQYTFLTCCCSTDTMKSRLRARFLRRSSSTS